MSEELGSLKWLKVLLWVLALVYCKHVLEGINIWEGNDSGKNGMRWVEMNEDTSLPLLVWKEVQSFFLLMPPSLFPGKRHAGGCSLLIPISSQVLWQKAKILKKREILYSLSITVAYNYIAEISVLHLKAFVWMGFEVPKQERESDSHWPYHTKAVSLKNRRRYTSQRWHFCQKDFYLTYGNSYLHQNVLCILVKPARIEWVIHTDRLEKLLFILAMERRLANKHLIQKDTKGPPVNGGVVLLPQQYLPKERSQKDRHKMSVISISSSERWSGPDPSKAALYWMW